MWKQQSDWRWGMNRKGGLWVALLLGGSGAAGGQMQTGNLYGKVADPNGAALPGVTVTLEAGESAEVRVSNAQGEFRFLGLPPAGYKLTAALDGFITVEHRDILVNIGRNARVEVTLNPAVTRIDDRIVVVGDPTLHLPATRPPHLLT